MDEKKKSVSEETKVANEELNELVGFEDVRNAFKKIDEKKLDKPDDKQTVTKDDFKKMGYQSRLKLFNENPELYNELSKN